MFSPPASLEVAVHRLVDMVGGAQGRLLLDVGSDFSLASLAASLVFAAVFLMLKRRGRPVPLKVFWRAMFPKRWLIGPSARADIGFFVFNTIMVGALFGWAFISAKAIRAATTGWMTDVLGAAAPTGLPVWLCGTIATLVLFLTYELAYWIDHALSHKVPFLWAFHKPHHTAQTLSPLTNFRVHPVDSIVFANIMSVFVGGAAGALTWAFGKAGDPFTLSGTNMILLAFVYTIGHLQHSQVWIACDGWMGRVFMSPAHHQIHHSADRKHFDRNFGSCLALWDWLFGTLCIPALKNERLTFGAEAAAPHSVTGCLVTPFVEAVKSVTPNPQPAATQQT